MYPIYFRCGLSLRLDYQVELTNGMDDCGFQRTTKPVATTTPAVDSTSVQLLVVTVIASTNTTIILAAIIYLLCRRCHVFSRISKLQAPIRLRDMIYDTDE